jgi:hypothetical protein
MLRRLFTVLSALPLVLCVGMIALWVRSHLAVDRLQHAAGGSETLAWSKAGRLGVTRSYPGEAGIRTRAGWELNTSTLVEPGGTAFAKGHPFHYRAIGFELASYDPAARTSWAPGFHGSKIRYWVAAVPHWFVVAVLAVPPALWLRRRQRERRAARVGHCPRCGYDLTANVSGTCPECGRRVAERAA